MGLMVLMVAAFISSFLSISLSFVLSGEDVRVLQLRGARLGLVGLKCY